MGKHASQVDRKTATRPGQVSFDPGRRLVWLKIVVAAGLMAGLLLSRRLWMGPRSFPFAPPFASLPPLPRPIEIAAFVLLLGLLGAILFAPKPRRLIFAALALAALLALFDQTRWQPWFYQYGFMLATLASFSWRADDADKSQAVFNTCRLIVASIYFYSGLQKLNPVFTAGAYPWMIEPIARHFPLPLQHVVLPLGLAVPFLEMGIGFGLLTSSLRKAAIVLAVLMLAFVALTLGPFGHNENSVVWPWNVSMVAFVFILFWRTEPFSVFDVLRVPKHPFHKVVFLLFAVMPAFSFFNLWDSYLSSSLYSGNTNFAMIDISDAVKHKLPADVQGFAVASGANRNDLKFFPWSFGELNVPPYPETRVFKAIARELCKYAEKDTDVILTVQGKRTWFNADSPSRYDCADLTTVEAGVGGR